MNVQEMMKGLRKERHLRQVDLAEYLQCSQRVYSNYECGEVKPSIQVLVKLAALYDTSVDYLLGLTDTKEPYPKKK